MPPAAAAMHAGSQSVDRTDRDRVTGARLRGSVVDIVVPPLRSFARRGTAGSQAGGHT